MFGRHLKPEYQTKDYNLIDEETENHVATRCMPLYDPIRPIMASGFMLALFVGLIFYYVIHPVFNLDVSDSTAIVLFGMLCVIGANIAYVRMSEPDTNTKRHR